MSTFDVSCCVSQNKGKNRWNTNLNMWPLRDDYRLGPKSVRATDIWSLSTGRRLDTLNRWRKTQERENNCNLFRLMSPVVPGERGVSSHDKRKLRSDWILEEPKSQRKGLVSLTVLGFYSLKLRASSW